MRPEWIYSQGPGFYFEPTAGPGGKVRIVGFYTKNKRYSPDEPHFGPGPVNTIFSVRVT